MSSVFHVATHAGKTSDSTAVEEHRHWGQLYSLHLKGTAENQSHSPLKSGYVAV